MMTQLEFRRRTTATNDIICRTYEFGIIKPELDITRPRVSEIIYQGRVNPCTDGLCAHIYALLRSVCKFVNSSRDRVTRSLQ